jgi:hypothetical protein
MNARNEMNAGPPRAKQSKITNLITFLSLLHSTYVLGNLNHAAANVGMGSTALIHNGSQVATAAPLPGILSPRKATSLSVIGEGCLWVTSGRNGRRILVYMNAWMTY